MKFEKIENIVSVIGDGGIGHPEVKDGHIIPVLVVDCTGNRALIDVCHLQQDTPPGDVNSVWRWNLLDRRNVYLRLDFVRPVKTSATIRFDVQTQGGLVCGIITAHAFYLQPSIFGLKVSESFHKPKILIEVPSHVTPPSWYSNFESQLVKRYRHDGYDKVQARQAAKQYMQRAKETFALRVPTGKKKTHCGEDTQGE